MSVLERCPSCRESNKGSKERQGPTLGVRLIEVSVKRESTVFSVDGCLVHHSFIHSHKHSKKLPRIACEVFYSAMVSSHERSRFLHLKIETAEIFKRFRLQSMLISCVTNYPSSFIVYSGAY